jgi:hypothetical protein
MKVLSGDIYSIHLALVDYSINLVLVDGDADTNLV